MERYKNFRPTCFDTNIPFDDNRDNWFIVPVGQNRDSGNLERSNFETALELLGGEGDNVEVHRFGHWANGWFEIIIVKPDTKESKAAEDIEASLENYPVLDEEDYSQKQFDDYCESWDNCYNSDFIAGLVRKFNLSESLENYLEDSDSETLRQFYEDLVDNSYEEDSGGVYCFVETAVDNCTEDHLAELLEDKISEIKNLAISKAMLTGNVDIFGEELRCCWDSKIGVNIEMLEQIIDN